MGNFRTSSSGHRIPSKPERTAMRRWGEELGFIEVLQQRADSLNIKRLLLIKENQISQIKEFSAFLYMGRHKSLYASQLSWGQYPVYFTSWVPLDSPLRVAAAWWMPSHRYSSPSWVLWGLRNSHLEGC